MRRFHSNGEIIHLPPNRYEGLLMKTNKELSDYEFIAMNNIKRAALAIFDGDYNKVETCLGEALECMYKVNT